MTAMTSLGRACCGLITALAVLSAVPAAAQLIPGERRPPSLTQPIPHGAEPELGDPTRPPPIAPQPAPRADEPATPAPPSGSADKKPGAADNAEKQAGKKKGPTESGPEQRAKLMGELYARLATAPDEETAVEVANAIEQLWMHSGSATADLLLARAGAATEAQRRDLAMKLLNAAVELQPDYAEAWNRRAYLFYLGDDMKRALGDIRRVLALEPRHFKALEGLASILVTLGEKKAALEAYESLLKIHPKMPGAQKTYDELKIEVEGRGI